MGSRGLGGARTRPGPRGRAAVPSSRPSLARLGLQERPGPVPSPTRSLRSPAPSGPPAPPGGCSLCAHTDSPRPRGVPQSPQDWSPSFLFLPSDSQCTSPLCGPWALPLSQAPGRTCRRRPWRCPRGVRAGSRGGGAQRGPGLLGCCGPAGLRLRLRLLPEPHADGQPPLRRSVGVGPNGTVSSHSTSPTWALTAGLRLVPAPTQRAERKERLRVLLPVQSGLCGGGRMGEEGGGDYKERGETRRLVGGAGGRGRAAPVLGAQAIAPRSLHLRAACRIGHAIGGTFSPNNREAQEWRGLGGVPSRGGDGKGSVCPASCLSVTREKNRQSRAHRAAETEGAPQSRARVGEHAPSLLHSFAPQRSNFKKQSIQ